MPSDEEWKDLERALGMDENVLDNPTYRGTNQGTQLKIGGTSGFSFVSLNYSSLNNQARFWTSTSTSGPITGSTINRGVIIIQGGVLRETQRYKETNWHSVRLVKAE